MDHRSIAAGRYQVSGMTCDHCVAAITEEVGALDGVTGVEVDLAAGDLTVHSSRVVSTDDVAAALAQAGYDLVHGARRGSDMTTSAAHRRRPYRSPHG